MLISRKGDSRIHLQEGKSHIVLDGQILPDQKVAIGFVRAKRVVVRDVNLIISDMNADELVIDGSCNITIEKVSGRSTIKVDYDKSHKDSKLMIADQSINLVKK